MSCGTKLKSHAHKAVVMERESENTESSCAGGEDDKDNGTVNVETDDIAGAEMPAKLSTVATDGEGNLDKVRLAEIVCGLVRYGCADTFKQIGQNNATAEKRKTAEEASQAEGHTTGTSNSGVRSNGAEKADIAGEATAANIVSPCKKTKLHNPYRKEVHHKGKGYAVGGLDHGKCSMKCPECDIEWGLEKMLRKYVCPNASCKAEIQDFFRSDKCELISGVPKATKEQTECFDAVSGAALKAFDLLGKKKYPTPEVMDELWKIRNVGVQGGLLLKDSYQTVAEHSGLKDAMANCIISIERQDKIGFRAHYAMVMYYMLVGYSHVTTAKRGN